MAHMESLWPRLAELPLVVESCEYDRLHAVLAHQFQRVTTYLEDPHDLPEIARRLGDHVERVS